MRPPKCHTRLLLAFLFTLPVSFFFSQVELNTDYEWYFASEQYTDEGKEIYMKFRFERAGQDTLMKVLELKNGNKKLIKNGKGETDARCLYALLAQKRAFWKDNPANTFTSHNSFYIRPGYGEMIGNMAKPNVLDEHGEYKNGLKNGLFYEGNFMSYGGSKKNPKLKLNENGNSRYFMMRGNYVNGIRNGVWEYHFGNIVFYGNVIDGKREGKWQSRKNPPTGWFDRETAYPYQMFPVEGNYKNGKPDGVFTIFDTSGKKVVEKLFYKDGEFVNYLYADYYNGKPMVRGDVLSDNSVKAIAYTPLGDTFSIRFAPLYYHDDASKNVVKPFYFSVGTYSFHQPFYYRPVLIRDKVQQEYQWDETGKIIRVTNLLNGMREGKTELFNKNGYGCEQYHENFLNGHSYTLNEKGDTLESINYLNGEYNGRFYSKDEDGKSETVKFFSGGKEKMIFYKSENTVMVENGKGKIVSKDSEKYYENGLCYLIITKYSGGNKKEVIAVDESGKQKLSEYYSERGKKIYENGNGTIPILSGNDMVVGYSEYKNGKLQVKTGDGKNPNDKIGVRRTIAKSKNPGEYIVTLGVSHGNLSGFVKIVERPALTDFKADKFGSTGDFIFSLNSGQIKFLAVNFPKEEYFELSYTISSIDTPQIDGEMVFVLDNQRASVKTNQEFYTANYTQEKQQENQEAQELKKIQSSQNNPLPEVDPKKIRQEISETGVNGEYLVTVSCNGAQVKTFTKIQYEISNGKVVGIEEGGTSNATVYNGAAKFIWVSFPAKGVQVVKFKVQTNDPSEKPVLAGTYNYVWDNQKVSFKIAQH